MIRQGDQHEYREKANATNVFKFIRGICFFGFIRAKIQFTYRIPSGCTFWLSALCRLCNPESGLEQFAQPGKLDAGMLIQVSDEVGGKEQAQQGIDDLPAAGPAHA